MMFPAGVVGRTVVQKSVGRVTGSLEEFAEAYRAQINPSATDAEVQEQFELFKGYAKGFDTVETAQGPMTRTQIKERLAGLQDETEIDRVVDEILDRQITETPQTFRKNKPVQTIRKPGRAPVGTLKEFQTAYLKKVTDANEVEKQYQRFKNYAKDFDVVETAHGFLTRSEVLNLLSGTKYTKYQINELFDRILDAKIAKSEEALLNIQNFQQQESERAKVSNRTAIREDEKNTNLSKYTSSEELNDENVGRSVGQKIIAKNYELIADNVKIKQDYTIGDVAGGKSEAGGNASLLFNKPYEIRLSREQKKEILLRGVNENKPIYAEDTKTNRFASYISKVQRIKGVYDVALHGRETSVDFFGTVIDAYTLSQIIRQRKDYTLGTTVRLLSCNVGNTNNTGDCVAQLVANELGVVVIAPTDILYVDANGGITVGKRNTGEMKKFWPRK